jgi:hypothetical protein
LLCLANALGTAARSNRTSDPAKDQHGTEIDAHIVK